MLSGLLTTFLSVAKYQSFTRAAEELYTTCLLYTSRCV